MAPWEPFGGSRLSNKPKDGLLVVTKIGKKWNFWSYIRFFAYLLLIKIKDANALLVLSEKMDVCYLLVDVQKLTI